MMYLLKNTRFLLFISLILSVLIALKIFTVDIYVNTLTVENLSLSMRPIAIDSNVHKTPYLMLYDISKGIIESNKECSNGKKFRDDFKIERVYDDKYFRVYISGDNKDSIIDCSNVFIGFIKNEYTKKIKLTNADLINFINSNNQSLISYRQALTNCQASNRISGLELCKPIIGRIMHIINDITIANNSVLINNNLINKFEIKENYYIVSKFYLYFFFVLLFVYLYIEFKGRK